MMWNSEDRHHFHHHVASSILPIFNVHNLAYVMKFECLTFLDNNVAVTLQHDIHFNEDFLCVFRLWWPAACRQRCSEQSSLPSELLAWIKLQLACDGYTRISGFSVIPNSLPDSGLRHRL